MCAFYGLQDPEYDRAMGLIPFISYLSDLMLMMVSHLMRLPEVLGRNAYGVAEASKFWRLGQLRATINFGTSACDAHFGGDGG